MSEHILITGASSGIGEALARESLSRGARITMVARRRALLEKIAETAPDRCHFIEADLTKPELAQGILDEAEGHFGPIDVLINNAGMQIVQAAASTNWEDAERMLRLNTLTPLRFNTLVLPRMISRKRGTIVDVASMAGIAPTPGMYFYNASKAALGAASEGLRAEVKPHGVHVVTVYPGPVYTPMEAAGRAAYEQSAIVKNVPTGRADVLAKKILDAVEHRRARVIYPAIYALSRHFPNLTRFIIDVTTPSVRQLPP